MRVQEKPVDNLRYLRPRVRPQSKLSVDTMARTLVI